MKPWLEGRGPQDPGERGRTVLKEQGWQELKHEHWFGSCSAGNLDKLYPRDPSPWTNQAKQMRGPDPRMRRAVEENKQTTVELQRNEREERSSGHVTEQGGGSKQDGDQAKRQRRAHLGDKQTGLLESYADRAESERNGRGNAKSD